MISNMKIFKHFIITLHLLTLILVVHTQSQLGFISIDCGRLDSSSYTDEETGIDYISDSGFIETGESNNITQDSEHSSLPRQFRTVRSFPTGIKNCYTIKLDRSGIKYLIRASFMYGNYDGKSQLPRFDLVLDGGVWGTVEFGNETSVVVKEILHLPQRNYVHVCLIHTYTGTPFVSSLEFRPLNNLTYVTRSGGSLLLHLRLDVGSDSAKPIRYKDDMYDRIWTPYTKSDWKQVTTTLPVNPDSEYQQPTSVMRTGATPSDGSDCLTYSTESASCTDNNIQYHVYMHFAELQVKNPQRQLNIYANGQLWSDTPYVPAYLDAGIVYRSANWSTLDFAINSTHGSLLPPILNAIEIYREQDLSQPLTDQQDVNAIKFIQTQYRVKRSSWQGDPCSPKAHLWQGLNCLYDDNQPPRIISLDLSSSGISGTISPFLSSLARLESLDLSNNSLSGPLPSFLTQLAYLKNLNLDGNQLKGEIPPELQEKKDAGVLLLNLEENRGLYKAGSGGKKKKNVLPIVATVVPALNLVGTLATIWILKTRNKGTPTPDQNDAKKLSAVAAEANGDDDNDGDVENGQNNNEEDKPNEEKDEPPPKSYKKLTRPKPPKRNSNKDNKAVHHTSARPQSSSSTGDLYAAPSITTHAASDDVDRTTKFVSPDISNPGEINEVPETTATANQEHECTGRSSLKKPVTVGKDADFKKKNKRTGSVQSPHKTESKAPGVPDLISSAEGVAGDEFSTKEGMFGDVSDKNDSAAKLEKSIEQAASSSVQQSLKAKEKEIKAVKSIQSPVAKKGLALAQGEVLGNKPDIKSSGMSSTMLDDLQNKEASACPDRERVEGSDVPTDDQEGETSIDENEALPNA